MKPAVLAGAALLMAVSSGAFAQTTQAPPAAQSPANASGLPSATQSPAAQSPAAQSPTNASGLPSTGSSGAMNSADKARPGFTADAGGVFANVPAQTGLSSKVVGLAVYNSENTDLGTIKDIAFDANGLKAYIVAVGGFLGMGDRYIAVRPSAINITYDAAKDKWQALMNTDL